MNILVGYVGGLEVDKVVLDLAIKHAKAFNANVHIASSLEKASDKEMLALEKVEKHLAYAKGVMTEEGIPCETHILVRGLTPGEDLVEFAIDRKVDEIIIGIEKTSKVGKLLFGSNAQYVILESPCPVVSVKYFPVAIK